MQDETMSPAEVGELFGVSKVTVLNYVHQRALPATAVPHGLRTWYRIRRRDAENFAEAYGIKVREPNEG